jgi:hypothetical protein
MAVDLAAGGVIYLQRQNGSWRFLAGRYAELEIEYSRFAGELPATIQIRSASAAPEAEVNLTLALSQVEVNGQLSREQLIAVKIPPGLSPITLQELRDSGPLGQ